MDCASWLSRTSMAIQCIPSSQNERPFAGFPLRPTHLIPPPRPFPPSTVAFFARRRKSSSPISSPPSSSPSKKKKHSLAHSDDGKDDDLDEDAFEALFKQLEEDLRNDDPSIDVDDGDDELTEEDLAMLERELAEALGDDDIEISKSTADEIRSGNGSEQDDDDDEEEVEEPIKLKNWQLRRLAAALKAGRRKTSIKSLAAELCLDRAVVLELLRDPPPNLLLLSAALPDEPAPTIAVPEIKPNEIVPEETTGGNAELETKVKMPVHVMQHRWSAQKRLKRVQVETLERVYNKNKRPTNAIISSIVQVTNLPRKRVLKWFEDKRTEDGIPNDRTPYQRSVAVTIFPHKTI